MFSTPYVNTKHATAKLVCLTLGVITTLTAYFSYSDSPWYYENLAHFCGVGHAHKELLIWNATRISMTFTMETNHCPSLIFERFFVYSNVFIFLVTSIMFIGCCHADIYTVNEVRNRDAAFHVMAAVVLIAGAILQIASAQKVEANRCWIAERGRYNGKTGEDKESCGFYFHHANKYIAAGFGFAAALGYLLTACVVENTKLLGMDPPIRATLEAGSTNSREELPVLPLTTRRSSTLENDEPGPTPYKGAANRKSKAHRKTVSSRRANSR